MKILYISVRNFIIYLKDFKELFLEKLIRMTIYAGAFLVPLFFVPLSNQFLEYSKVILFYILVIWGLLFWLLKIYLTKKLSFELHFLDGALILFVIIYFLASLFSVDPYQSLIGRNLSINFSFVTVFFLILFYFLVTRFFKNLKEIKALFLCLIISIFLLLLNNILGIFSINWLPNLLGNTINSFYYLIFLALILSASLLFLTSNRKDKILFLAFSFIFLLVIFALDNQIILLILTLAIFLFILLSSFRSQYFSNKLVIILTVLLFLSVIILILPIGNWLGLINPVELNLPLSFGWQITKSSLTENLLFGVGPQNFAFSFYKYKPIQYNQTNFWQLGFEKNSNFWLENLNNIGLFGILIFLIIIIKYFYKLITWIRRFEITENFALEKIFLAIIISIVLASLIILGIFCNFNFILFYLFFLFLALGVVIIQSSILENTFVNKYFINLLVYLILILLISFGYFGLKIILAEALVTRVIAKDYATIEDFKWGENNLQKALKYNPWQYDYNLNLITLQINKLLFLQKSGETEETEDLLKQILDNLDSVLKKEIKKIDYYLVLQQSYTALKQLGLSNFESEQRIIEKLLALDPNNPELYIDSALLKFDQYLLVKSGQVQVADKEVQLTKLLKEVKADIEKSLELKNNYVLGYYNLGLYYQELGDEEKTLANIEKAYNIDQSQKLVVLSLKKLYLNQDKVDKAIEVLNKYLEFYPKDIEVRLELAIVYKDKKDLVKTQDELNKILEIDPENKKAKELLLQIK